MDTEGYFDGLANSYTNDFNKSAINQIIRHLKIRSGMRILEAGCGNGEFTSYLLDATDNSNGISLLDMSGKMIDRARKRLKSGYKDRRLRFFRGDMATTDMASDSFDLIVCFNCFPHFEEYGFCHVYL